MMRRQTLGTVLALLASTSVAPVKAADTGVTLSGRWLVTADLYATPIYGRLDIEQQGQKITGQFYGDKFEGSLDGSAIHFPSRGAPPTGDSGSYGGNMDFNEIVEGATIYLPVSAPGALLYFGDGHAAQGDGELNGNALETSLDVELTVDVLPGRRTPGPRVESSTHIMAMGLGGSLDDAFRSSTANMAGWLAEDYKLTPVEIAELVGTAAEYRVSEVADRNAGMVLKIYKERLKGLAAEETK
jgi:acetamidase/formamidase